MTTLENLWYGNIRPFEEYLENNEEYQKILRSLSKEREKLSEDFPPEKLDALKNYDAITNEMNSVAETEAFKLGFSLAMKIVFEVGG